MTVAFFRQSGKTPFSKLLLMQFTITSPNSSIESRMRFVGIPSGPVLDFLASFLLRLIVSSLEVGNRNMLFTDGFFK